MLFSSQRFMQIKIPTPELGIGMFVADIDRPWIDTPFLFQGFLIENDEQLAQLNQYCKQVIVDPSRSTEPAKAAIASYANRIGADNPDSYASKIFRPSDQDAAEPEEPDARLSLIPANVKVTRFRNFIPVEAELAPAENAYERTGAVLSNLIRDIRADKQLALDEVEDVIQDVVNSMVRNPDALMLVSRMREQDEVIYGHGLNVAIYLVALGRHLGLPKNLLERLGTLGLLLDIGKTRIPRELLLKKERLTTEEFEIVKSHVRLGIDILKNTPDLHPDILQAIAQHHEREDGSGYPAGLVKAEIGLFGRMASIVDSFSALTNPRPYADIIPAYDALQMLANWGDKFYNASIVEQFIHAIGIFPVGSMVELSSGEVAVVVSHNKVRRLKPRVLIISGPDKSPSKNPGIFDLLYQKATEEDPITILYGLPTGAYGLNPREYYVT